MAVEIPPWLNIDPIAPARILQAGIAERNRATQAQQALAQRQQQLELEAQVESARIAEQERTSLRRQLMSDQLAQMEAQRHAEDVAVRREQQARSAAQFQQTIQLREKAAERAAAEASIQAEGSRGLQADLDSGMSIEQALPRHAGKLFYRHPERMVPAMRAVEPPQPGWTPSGQEYMTDPRGGVHFPPRLPGAAATGPITQQQVLDAQGQPTGITVIPRTGGRVVVPPRSQLSPEGRLHAITAELGVINNMMVDATKAERPALRQRRDALLEELRNLRTSRGVAAPAAVLDSSGDQGNMPPEDEGGDEGQ